METSQNLENVQKTNLKNFHTQFDHLSVVPEENSTENSEKNSNRASLPNDMWTCDVIQPDQSYPIYENVNSPKSAPAHFFAPIPANKKYEECENDEFVCGPKDVYPNFPDYHQTAQHFGSQGLGVGLNQEVVGHFEKSKTDLIVKMDNQNFVNTPSQSTFSNGGNLEELLHDIESISQDILKISTVQGVPFVPHGDDIINQIQNTEMTYVPNSKVDNLEFVPDKTSEDGDEQRPYKSEINVVLMPTPMPLIGFDKYRNIQQSCESISSRTLENMSASQPNLKIIPEPAEQTVLIPTPNTFLPTADKLPLLTLTPSGSIPPPPLAENRVALNNFPTDAIQSIEQTNPFFFGSLRDSYSNSAFFNARYNPENFANNDENKPEKAQKTETEISNSKSNLLDGGQQQEQAASENEENSKVKTANVKVEEVKKPETAPKSPKLSIRRKVSIHFKGKKDKNAKSKNLDAIEVVKTTKTTSVPERKSIFDKFIQDKKLQQKTPSVESKKSDAGGGMEPKTPTSSDSKTSNQKSSSAETKASDMKNDRTMSLPAFPEAAKTAVEKKQRKSTSVSPDRKHVHMKEESGGKKCHKKHRKGDRSRTRRSSLSTDRFLRERSFSVCTDRSNILDHRLGLGFGSSYLYDEYNSDRERTNSLSSCETIKTRKMSNISNVPLSGKIPWCGCWGNGCV